MLGALPGAAPGALIGPKDACAKPTSATKPARPIPADVAAARAHFKQGRAYQEAGAWADATREYEKAYALAPLPELLYNIAQCHRLGGDKVKAIAAYQRYLALAPEGALSDEARSHVAALSLRIQVEEAEAARRRAEAEAEAAKRRAKELHEVRRQAAAEALETLKEEQARQAAAVREETQRRQREAARAKRRREAAEVAYGARVKAAKREGRALRISGITLQVLSSVVIGVAALGTYNNVRKEHDLAEWDSPGGRRWYGELEGSLATVPKYRAIVISLYTAGGAILATGIALYVLGKRQGRRAVESVERPVTLLPSLSPGGAGLVMEGRF